MGLYAVAPPIFEFAFYDVAGALGLEAEGVSGEIQGLAFPVRRDVEAFAERCKHVFSIKALRGLEEFTLVCPIVVEGHGRWNGVDVGECPGRTGR